MQPEISVALMLTNSDLGHPTVSMPYHVRGRSFISKFYQHLILPGILILKTWILPRNLHVQLLLPPVNSDGVLMRWYDIPVLRIKSPAIIGNWFLWFRLSGITEIQEEASLIIAICVNTYTCLYLQFLLFLASSCIRLALCGRGAETYYRQEVCDTVWQGGANNCWSSELFLSPCAQMGGEGVETGVKRIQCEPSVCRKAETICARERGTATGAMKGIWSYSFTEWNSF